jgi:hypothetical protein
MHSSAIHALSTNIFQEPLPHTLLYTPKLLPLTSTSEGMSILLMVGNNFWGWSGNFEWMGRC